MIRVVFDANLKARLEPLSTLTEVCDEAGRTLGFFHPLQSSHDEESARSPFKRDELERLRRQRTGRALSEILKELGEP